MKLDSRIILQTDILTCFDTERAKDVIGQIGYFADNLYRFDDLRYCDYGTLTDVRDCQSGGVFHRRDADSYQWFFIPESCLKPREKKFRPYTLMEFFDKFTVGRPIRFRKKGEVGYERFLILNGYVDAEKGAKANHYIYIGSNPYSLEELFEKYEWQEHTEGFKPFEPFGVEE